MSEMIQVELTTTQRDLLLRGLQFVRSSVKLSIGPSRIPDEQRSEQLEAIETLERVPDVGSLMGSLSAR